MNSEKPYQWHGQVFGTMPVQGQGRLEGRAWFFRARHDGWSVRIALNRGTSPVDWLAEARWQTGADDYEDAGNMSEEEAWKLIHESFEKFLETMRK